MTHRHTDTGTDTDRQGQRVRGERGGEKGVRRREGEEKGGKEEKRRDERERFYQRVQVRGHCYMILGRKGVEKVSP